ARWQLAGLDLFRARRLAIDLDASRARGTLVRILLSERPLTGAVRVFPRPREPAARCEPVSRERGTRPGAAGANRRRYLSPGSRPLSTCSSGEHRGCGAVGAHHTGSAGVAGSNPASSTRTPALYCGGPTEALRPLGW